ncbi:hypothetical protein [Fibrella arboris]|uniref:hypothetical protein n=1 Tax=Fibrella arboris TaxID=3242486 RepID=UPI003521DAA5
METFGKLIGFAIFSIGVLGIYFLMSGRGRLDKLGTWSALEKSFRIDAMPASHTYTSGLIGFFTFTDTLKIAFDATGIFLDVPDFFRFGSKPLHIPYSALTVSTKNPTLTFGFRTYTQFIVANQSVCIEQAEAQKILARQAVHP